MPCPHVLGWACSAIIFLPNTTIPNPPTHKIPIPLTTHAHFPGITTCKRIVGKNTPVRPSPITGPPNPTFGFQSGISPSPNLDAAYSTAIRCEVSPELPKILPGHQPGNVANI